jgi:hypothetical protein
MTRIAAVTTLLLAALAFDRTGEAHKGITSRFTYNTEVHPVLLSRCGRCHVDGGVGPMSLLTYEDAFPWAESLRAELLAAADHLPAEAVSSGEKAGSFVRAAHRQISARELDIVLDWATGGTPEGDKASRPAPVAFAATWARGTPDLVFPMVEPFEVPAGTLEQTQEFVLPIAVAQPQSAGQFDLLPGNAAIVRSADITLRSKDGQTRMLGTWFPRQTPVPLALKPPVRLEPGATVVARIHYKKSWKHEGQALSDRSTVGFYLAD